MPHSTKIIKDVKNIHFVLSSDFFWDFVSIQVVFRSAFMLSSVYGIKKKYQM